jgi:DsbC/DsbD-like thiol-disulfide interchange protein
LRAFTDTHAITFALLSDVGSKTIDAWGIRNREATGRAAGIPHPGTYVIDRQGVIVSRTFQEAYQERETAASILAGLQGASPALQGATEATGRHLTLRASLSDSTAAPGHRVTLVLDVTPGRNVHVYAPGQEGYLAVALKLDPSPDFKAAAPRYPTPRDYFFAPLRERVKVYDRPFRILQDVTLALTPAVRQRAQERGTLTLTGALEYQACDDTVCFRPDSVPLRWTISLTPIER